MVCRKVGDGADDVVQEVALRAVRHAGQYDATKGKITTWLRWMVVEAVRRHYQLAERLPCSTLGECAPAQDREAGPERVAIQRERARLVREAVSRLPRRSREAMKMHLEGLNCTQIGKALGRTKQAAVHRIERAKGLMRVELGEG